MIAWPGSACRSAAGQETQSFFVSVSSWPTVAVEDTRLYTRCLTSSGCLQAHLGRFCWSRSLGYCPHPQSPGIDTHGWFHRCDLSWFPVRRESSAWSSCCLFSDSHHPRPISRFMGFPLGRRSLGCSHLKKIPRLWSAAAMVSFDNALVCQNRMFSGLRIVSLSKMKVEHGNCWTYL